MSRGETIWGWSYYLFQIFVLQFVIEFVCLLAKIPLTLLGLNVIYFCVNFAALTIILFSFLKKSVVRAAKDWKKTLKAVFLGFIVYWVLNLLVYNLILQLKPEYYNLNDNTISTMAHGNFSLLIFCTVVLAPVAEELVFRGLIFQGLYNKNHIIAYLVSTLAFSAIHVIPYIGVMSPMHMLLSTLQYVPAGIALAWAYAKADTICAPISIHMLVNFLGTVAMR